MTDFYLLVTSLGTFLFDAFHLDLAGHMHSIHPESSVWWSLLIINFLLNNINGVSRATENPEVSHQNQEPDQNFC